MARSTQTVHLSCVKTSIISNQNEMSFHLSHVTWDYHRVCLKWFLSWWYVWHKSCTNLVPIVTLYPKRKKWDSTWPTSPKSSIGCIQNDFLSLWSDRRIARTYLASRSALSPKGPKRASTWASSPSGTIFWSKMIYEPMVRLVQTVHLSCIDGHIVSKRKEERFHMIHVT
jgi:hypothetical protein